MAALLASGCRSATARAPSAPPLTANERARKRLCVDVGAETCLAACPDDAPPREHADCLLSLRFESDPVALELARSLTQRTRVLVGVEGRSTVNGYRGQHVPLIPALPLGTERHHLAWLRTSMESFDSFLSTLRDHTDKPVSFSLRPHAFMFFRTASPTFPSAYTWQGDIGYNLAGPLHTSARDVHETLFHELFHVNDEQRAGWSYTALGPLFESIVARCGDADHQCFTPFAPHDSLATDGTYYAFDERTRDVREYGAELALRYLLEHEAVLAGGPPMPPFKCRTAENLVAWERLKGEFFGGADLTPSCAD